MDALKTRQELNYCGPCGLAYALYLLTGKEVSQEDIVRKAMGRKGDRIVRSEGMGPYDLSKAARKYGAVAVFKEFLRKELIEGENDGDPSTYFAIALHNADDSPPSFMLTDRLRAMLEDEEYDSVTNMADDLLALVRESSGGGKDREMLADELVKIRPAVKSGLKQLDWDSTELTLDECMSFYDDYIAVAKACRFIVGAPQDRVMMAANMTATISTCAWWGEL